MNQFAEQVYNSKQRLESSDEEGYLEKQNAGKQPSSPLQAKSDYQSPAGEMTVQQLKALKRER